MKDVYIIAYSIDLKEEIKLEDVNFKLSMVFRFSFAVIKAQIAEHKISSYRMMCIK